MAGNVSRPQHHFSTRSPPWCRLCERCCALSLFSPFLICSLALAHWRRLHLMTCRKIVCFAWESFSSYLCTHWVNADSNPPRGVENLCRNGLCAIWGVNPRLFTRTLDLLQSPSWFGVVLLRKCKWDSRSISQNCLGDAGKLLENYHVEMALVSKLKFSLSEWSGSSDLKIVICKRDYFFT